MPLKASRQFLESVLGALSAHVCVLDETGHIVLVNRAWREFTRRSAAAPEQALEGADYLAACERAALAPPPNGPACRRFTDLLREVLAGQRSQFQLECAGHSPAEQRWFVAHVARIDGIRPLRVAVALDDVTAVKQAQQTLARSEALLLDLAASIPGAMFRLARSLDGLWKFIYMSPGIEALFGVSPAQACGSFRSLRERILSVDLAAHDASIGAAIAVGHNWQHEYRIRMPDGQLKWILARANCKRDEAGQEVWTGTLSDVSERKHMEAVLKASEETYRTLFETVPQGVVYQDAQGRITSANPAAQRILGLTLDQMQGRTSIDPRWHAMHEDGTPFPGEQHPAMVALRSRQPVKDVVMGVALPDKGRVWILVNATPMLKLNRLEGVYSTFEDITERMQLSQELRRQASTDDLTGVANRRSLMARLTSEFERIARHPALHCSVLALDLDLFKQVNDTWGHAAGDAVLLQVSRLMREATRQHDVVGRSGGEEFTLLLPDTQAAEALMLAERLRRRIDATPVLHAGLSISVTASMGLSVILPQDLSIDAVLARADMALYDAKHQGRNRVHLFGLHHQL